MALRNEGLEEEILSNRAFTKCNFPKDWISDQKKKLSQPPMDKKGSGAHLTIKGDFESILKTNSYFQLLEDRQSERVYTDQSLSQQQLAFMLWSAQGVKYTRNEYASMRPVPSGGARHPFELYFTVQENGVEGLEPGIYHYLPFENVGSKDVAIEYLGPLENYEEQVKGMLVGQKWAAKAPVTLFLSCVAYRAEWRYSILAHRVLLIDLGHVGQNIMLSASAMGLGSCCIAAFDAEKCDDVLDLDGVEEYTVYAVPFGYVKE